MATTPPPTARFQAGHTYTRTVASGATEKFHVERITYQPDTGAAFASGWKGGLGAWYGCLVPVTDCLGWADAGPTHPTAGSQPEHCMYCGKAIRRITGTLAAWWVHDPGGNTVCFPEQAASSSRATPKPAAGVGQDGAQTQEAEPEPSRVVRCSRAILSRPHDAHDWEPQPGMDPVHCPGYRFTEEPQS
jgi:hypothetical protein